MSTPLDPQRCPLCGSENQCAVARGRGNCWCFTQPIPDAVLEKIPQEARDRACVCQNCARGKRDPSKVYARLLQILRQRNGN